MTSNLTPPANICRRQPTPARCACWSHGATLWRSSGPLRHSNSVPHIVSSRRRCIMLYRERLSIMQITKNTVLCLFAIGHDITKPWSFLFCSALCYLKRRRQNAPSFYHKLCNFFRGIRCFSKLENLLCSLVIGLHVCSEIGRF